MILQLRKCVWCVGLAISAHILCCDPSFSQFSPLDFVSSTPITDNNPFTNEVGRDRASINSTSFKNESLITEGDYQFTTYYREDGKLMVARRDHTAVSNHWDIRVTEFTSFNINDAHNVPVIGIDGDGFLHLAWGTHGNPLLYTRSTTPVTSGQALSFTGDTIGNSAAINTMTGAHETGTTYPNFIRIPSSDDLLFNYRTGGSGNGVYRMSRYDDVTDTWSWTSEEWITNTDSSGLTYNAYPHNMSYDSNGGLHASWTFRYNSSSPTGNVGFQTNHNLMYAYSPDDGVTWYRDIGGTDPYVVDIDDQTAEVIVPIPEGSSLINTGTQAIDVHNRPAIATWWAPRANDPRPDHRRQYMYVGHNGDGWFTSQITHRTSDDPNALNGINEASLGINPTRRPQIVIDDYNRAYVLFNQGETNGKPTIAWSQAESRDDWEFIELDPEDVRNTELTLDRALWESSKQMHIFVQKLDGNSANGGTPARILEWDTAAAMGRVLKWTGDATHRFDTTALNFTDLGAADNFESYDHVIFDDSGRERIVEFTGNVDAGKITVDTSQAYTFNGAGALTSGSLAVVGGGSLELATSGNTYSGQTRVSNATLSITGDTNAMTSKMIAAAGGTLIMDGSDASSMTSDFEVWPTGTLQIGTTGSSGNVFPNNPSSILNDGLIRLETTETLQNVTGIGTIEVAAGATTLQANPTYEGELLVRAGATAIVADQDGLGSGDLRKATLESGSALQLTTDYSLSPPLELNGGGSATIDVVAGSTTTFAQSIDGEAGLTKQGDGTLQLSGNNTYAGPTVVANGTLAAGGQLSGDLIALSGTTVRVIPTTPPAFSYNIIDDFETDTADDYTKFLVLDTGADSDTSVSDSVFGVSGGTATVTTTAFDDIEQQLYAHSSASIEVGEELQVDVVSFSNASRDMGLFVGNAATSLDNATTAENNVRADFMYVTVGSNFSSSTFDSSGATEGTAFYGGMEEGDTLFIALTDVGVVESGFYNVSSGNARVVVTTRADLDGIDGTAVGFWADVRDNGTMSQFDNLRIQGPAGPADGFGTLSIAGDFSLDPGSNLELNVFDVSSYDSMDVAGLLSLGGDLRVTLDATAPALQSGDSFDILNFGSLTGTFGALDLPPLANGLGWDISELLVSGILEVVDSADFDGDGDVDGADFLAIQRSSPTLIPLWELQFGASPSVAASHYSASVPEPRAVALFAASIMCIAANRRCDEVRI